MFFVCQKSNLKSTASQVMPKIRDQRNVNSTDVQKCRLAVGDDALVSSRINSFSATVLAAVVSTTSSRKRRSRLLIFVHIKFSLFWRTCNCRIVGLIIIKQL